MASDEYGARPSTASALGQSWQATVTVGALSVILGFVVSLHPTGSLNVISILIGVLMILSGIFHLIRVFEPEEMHRVWLGLAGLVFIVLGVVLIRHLHITTAVIGLIVGITWIVQGLTALIGGIASDAREGRGWWITFGLVSLVAGIVVAATPVASVTVLAVLLGTWFIIMGIFEIIAGLLLRRALRAMPEASQAPVSPDAGLAHP
jgi:uncharacterized membrane protein HdeD (DUF308 family)